MKKHTAALLPHDTNLAHYGRCRGVTDEIDVQNYSVKSRL